MHLFEYDVLFFLIGEFKVFDQHPAQVVVNGVASGEICICKMLVHVKHTVVCFNFLVRMFDLELVHKHQAFIFLLQVHYKFIK